jgi:hypothetical protein
VSEKLFDPSDEFIDGWTEQHCEQNTDNQEFIPADRDHRTAGNGTDAN